MKTLKKPPASAAGKKSGRGFFSACFHTRVIFLAICFSMAIPVGGEDIGTSPDSTAMEESLATLPDALSFSNLEEAMDYLKELNAGRSQERPGPDEPRVIDRYADLAETGISLTYTPSAKISANPFDRPIQRSYPRPAKDSKPVLYVDGVQRDEDYVVRLPQEVIESINVVTGEAAMQRYGQQSSTGLIVIMTRLNPVEGGGNNSNYPLENRQIIKDWSGVSMTKAALRAEIAKSWKDAGDMEKAFFVIDGQQKDFETLEQLEPADIYSLSILSSEAAVSIYGEKGVHGALIIATKALFPMK